MSNEKLARQWAERKKAQAKRHVEDAGYFPREDTLAAIEHVLATTTDPLTMADVEWEVEKHYLAGATSEIDGSELVMVAPLDDLIVSAKPGGDRVSLTSPETLTPNGKKYELREVGATAEPEHPATLETQADYENAPEGTVVAEPCWPAWQSAPAANGYTRKASATVAALLAEAAPALAELVAGMHYKYAVQITDVTGETRFATSLHGATLDIESALWTPEPFDSLADYWRESNNVEEVCIVRRLMSAPEVVDPPSPNRIHFCTEDDLFGDIEEVDE